MRIREATAADTGAIAALHYASGVRTYTPIVPPEVSAQFSLAERKAAWARVFAGQRGFVLVAEDGGGIVGVAQGGPSRGTLPCTGELYVLHVAADVQGRGVGRALVAATAARLAAGGMGDMCLWCLRDNTGARRFYERIGGRVVRERDADFSGTPVPEVLYAYADTAALARKADEPPRRQDAEKNWQTNHKDTKDTKKNV